MRLDQAALVIFHERAKGAESPEKPPQRAFVCASSVRQLGGGPGAVGNPVGDTELNRHSDRLGCAVADDLSEDLIPRRDFQAAPHNRGLKPGMERVARGGH